MKEQLLNIISQQQLFTFACLAFVGALGAACKHMILHNDFEKSPYKIKKLQAKSWDAVISHIACRLLLGSVAGLLVGLMLVDAIKPESGPFLRLLFFGWVAGYSAPELMKSQEKALFEALRKKVKFRNDEPDNQVSG